MGKTQLQKHMDELEEMTSGNSKDAVTFAGRGLELLKSMIGLGNLSKSKGGAGETEADEDPEDAADTNEDHDATDEGLKKSTANGGELTNADEDPEDPADTGNEASGGSIITNKGKKISKDGSAAVKKSFEFDEDKFKKSVETTYEDVIDASEAVAELAKSVKVIGRAHNDNSALIKSVLEQNVTLARAVGELLKSSASIAAELESIKNQPVAPASGFVVMSKKEGTDSNKTPKGLQKSDIQDALVDAMNSGHEEAGTLLKRLGVCHSPQDIKNFVDNVLPDDIRETL